MKRRHDARRVTLRLDQRESDALRVLVDRANGSRGQWATRHVSENEVLRRLILAAVDPTPSSSKTSQRST